jgi:SNARE protein 1
MSVRTNDQILHDRVNLPRLVKRLEKSVSEDDWSDSSQRDTWIKAQGTLQVRSELLVVIIRFLEADDVLANPARPLAPKERRG